jgi:hypothetical protein
MGIRATQQSENRRVLRRSECAESSIQESCCCICISRDALPLADVNDGEDSLVATSLPTTPIFILLLWAHQDPARSLPRRLISLLHALVIRSIPTCTNFRVAMQSALKLRPSL